MLKIISRVIRLCIIVFFVMISTSYVYKIESKTYSDNKNKTVDLSTMALKLEEFKENDLYGAKDTFTGDLTGYVFNCPLCNGTLGCMRKYDITDGRDYYDDAIYGRVKIVASSSNLACGSIVRINSKRISDEPTIAIVLDRGVIGNALDLLSPNLEYAYNNVGRSVVTYDVLRYGWGNSKN